MSRKLEDLHPEMLWHTKLFLEEAEKRNLDVLVYSTLRPAREQAKLYRRGRSISSITRKADELHNVWRRPDLGDLLMAVGPQYGDLVTNAGPGQSLHNYGLAFDAVPVVNGDLVWKSNREEWETYAECVRAAGLDWGGDWSGMITDKPHAQQMAADWRKLIHG